MEMAVVEAKVEKVEAKAVKAKAMEARVREVVVRATVAAVMEEEATHFAPAPAHFPARALVRR